MGTRVSNTRRRRMLCACHKNVFVYAQCNTEHACQRKYRSMNRRCSMLRACYKKNDATQRTCAPANHNIRRQRNIRVHTFDTQNNARLPTKTYRSKTRRRGMLRAAHEKHEATDRTCVLPAKAQRRQILFVAGALEYLT